MTPAIDALRKAHVAFRIHQYAHAGEASSCSGAAWGAEAVAKLGVPAGRVFKTLVVESDSGTLAVGIVPVAGQLDLKQLAKALGCKKVGLAAPDRVARSTGYVLGGVSPLGQKRRLPTVIDASAQHFETIFISAGRRGLELELAPGDLAAQLAARFADIGRA